MKVITICGSMRFEKEIIKIATELEINNGVCVLQPAYNIEGKSLNENEIEKLTSAHYKKIDVSDAIYVVNIGGYIGKSVTEEIAYAKKHNKDILYHE